MATTTFIPIVYDGPDVEAAELTAAVAAGARYFYNVDDTGGSWYVLLASSEKLADPQQAWDEFAELERREN